MKGTAREKLRGVSEGLLADGLGLGETNVPVGVGEILGLGVCVGCGFLPYPNSTIPTIATTRITPIILIDLLMVISQYLFF